jgi:hypothetical protein
MTARIPDVVSGEGGQLAEILERRVRRTVPAGLRSPASGTVRSF